MANFQALVEELTEEVAKSKDAEWSVQLLEANGRWRLFTREVLAEVVSRVVDRAIPAGAAVLDLGAGQGQLASLLQPGRWELTELDPSFELCRTNAQTGSGRILCATGEALPLRDSSQDAVVSLTVLDILDNAPAVMAEVARVLKPGGRFIHFHDLLPNLSAILSRDNVLVLPYARDQRVKGYQVVWRSQLQKHRRAFSRHGWSLIEACLRDPDTAEHLRSEARIIEVLTAELSGIKGLRRQVITDPMQEFEKLATRIAKQAGLRVEFAGGETAETVVPLERTYVIDQKVALLDDLIRQADGDPVLSDLLGKIPNRYVTRLGKIVVQDFDEDLAADIGPDMVYIASTIHVFWAVKPA